MKISLQRAKLLLCGSLLGVLTLFQNAIQAQAVIDPGYHFAFEARNADRVDDSDPAKRFADWDAYMRAILQDYNAEGWAKATVSVSNFDESNNIDNLGYLDTRINGNYDAGFNVELREQFNKTWSGDVTYDNTDWFEVGQKFANYFGDKVAIYGFQKLPNWPQGDGIPADTIVAILRRFAEGVKSVSGDYAVGSPKLEIPYIRSTDPVELAARNARTDSMLVGFGELVNEGLLNTITIEYNNNLGDYTSYDSSLDYRPIAVWNDVIATAGINEDANVSFVSNRFIIGDTLDLRNRYKDDYASYDPANYPVLAENGRIMKTMWDALLIAGDDPLSYVSFMQMFHMGSPRWHANIGWGGESNSALEGKTRGYYEIDYLHRYWPALVTLGVCDGTAFETTNTDHGTAGLKGNDKTVWYYHNAEGWTDLWSADTIVLAGVPSGATSLSIYTAESQNETDAKKELTITVENGEYSKIATSDLPAGPVLFQTDQDGATDTLTAVLSVAEYNSIDFSKKLPLSLKEDLLFSLYPNPVADMLKIQLADRNQSFVKIINTIGQVVASQHIQSGDEIDVSKLKSGLYFVEINGHSQKLIIKR